MILDERQAWLLFIGLLGATMGVTLFCDADEYSAAVAGGSLSSGLEPSRGLTVAYRAAGSLFGLAGAGLAAAALAAPHRIAGRFQPFEFNDRGRLAGGVIFVLLGTTMAAVRMTMRPAKVHSKLAAGARWARVGLVTLYGCFLFSRIGGLPQ